MNGVNSDKRGGYSFLDQWSRDRRGFFYPLDIKRWTEIKKYGKISIRNDVMKLEFRG